MSGTSTSRAGSKSWRPPRCWRGRAGASFFKTEAHALRRPSQALDAGEKRHDRLALRRRLVAALELAALQDLHVGAHHHAVVGRMTPGGAAIVLGQGVLDVGLAGHDVA